MIALITPLPEKTTLQITTEPRPFDEEVDDAPAPDVALEPLEAELLADALSDHPMPFLMNSFSRKQACGVSAAAIAFSRLELKGLVENGMRGRKLTVMGLTVARQQRRDSAMIDA